MKIKCSNCRFYLCGCGLSVDGKSNNLAQSCRKAAPKKTCVVPIEINVGHWIILKDNQLICETCGEKQNITSLLPNPNDPMRITRLVMILNDFTEKHKKCENYDGMS